MRGVRAGILLGSLMLAAMPTMAEPPTLPAKPGQYGALEKLPDWTGVWTPDFSGISQSRNAVPMLVPAAAKSLADFNAAKASGKNTQTQLANCVPPGMPQIMRMPYPMEFAFTVNKIILVIETESQVRQIYTDGRPLPEDPDPYFNGWSIGHWEGDTLVVDTIGLNPKVSLVEGVHPTEKTKIQERMRLIEKNKLQIVTTISDPDVFAQPFVLTTNYARRRDWQIKEYVCQENNHDAADEFGRPSFELEKK